jgi:acyl-CoA thioester hydrolase
MSEWKITYRGIVYPWQCDHMGHMNVMYYANKFDEACWQLLSMIGLGPARFAEEGTGMAAVEQHIQYRRELRAGQAVTIQSAILEVKDKSIHMLHKLVDDATGEVSATTVVVGVHIDGLLRKAISIPQDVRAAVLRMRDQEFAALQ